MKQKSAEKLFAGHPHQPLLALMGIVLPAKRNLAVGNFHDPVWPGNWIVSIYGTSVSIPIASPLSVVDD
jgi:hypothetical protein